MLSRNMLLSVSLLVTTLAMGIPGAPPLAGEEVSVDGVPHVRNGAHPADGSQTWQLEELWHAGGDDDEILLGVISHIIAGEDGTIFILDRQLSQVHAYSPDGQFLRTLVREGEGPGEIHDARGMVLLPDGKLAIAQGFPGKFKLVNREGHPAGEIALGGDDPSARGFNFLDEAIYRQGHFAVTGRQMRQTDNGFNRIEYLATLHLDGREKVRLIEKQATNRLMTGKFVERDEYFVSRGGWSMGPEGKIYAAEERDRYAVSVYAPDGRLERVIEREFRPRKRSAEEKADVGAGLIVIINGERIAMEVEAEDYAPCISRLRVADNGDLWVLSSRGTHKQPEGVLQTYDVFDPAGHFVRQVSMACEGDALNDRLFFIGTDRVIRVKGYVDAARGQAASGSGDEDDGGEPEPIEVICYAVH